MIHIPNPIIVKKNMQYRERNRENYLFEDCYLKACIEGAIFRNHEYREKQTKYPFANFQK